MALTLGRQWPGAINEAERQVVAADVIVVNKVRMEDAGGKDCMLTRNGGYACPQCDLVDKGAVHTLTTTLSKMNGVATIVTTSHSEGA